MVETDNQIMIYETGAKTVKFNLDEKTETLWATRMQMAELFDVTPQSITMHMNNVYNEGELIKSELVRKFY